MVNPKVNRKHTQVQLNHISNYEKRVKRQILHINDKRQRLKEQTETKRKEKHNKVKSTSSHK